MWERLEDKLALLELLTQPALKRRGGQQDAFTLLSELSWTRASARRDEVVLVTERRQDLIALLDRVWPEWRAEHIALLEAGEPPTPTGWGKLADRRRAESLPDLPDRLNRRTAAAATAQGAKSSLTGARLEALGDREVVDDGIVRVRPAGGVIAHRDGHSVALVDVEDVLDEVGISDRALRDGLLLEGPIKAIVTVENLGAWRDMPKPDGWMLIHVAGWNTSTVRRLHALLKNVPALHFGDLDPNGVRIFQHLRQHIPGLLWLVPSFWREFIPLHAQVRAWPGDLDLTDAPPLVRELAATGKWMEQERLVLDPRFLPAMEGALADAVRGRETCK